MSVVNGITYPSVTLLQNGQSITGSFYKFQTLASGSVVGTAPYSAQVPVHFMALKDATGTNIATGVGLFIPVGMTIEMQVTSASLDTTSAPILLYS
jgi:hypothetical protein